MANPNLKLHKEVVQHSYNGKAVRFRLVENEVFIPVTDLRNLLNIKFTEYPAHNLCASASRIVFYANGTSLQSIVSYDIENLCLCGKHRKLTKAEQDKIEWTRSMCRSIKDDEANRELEATDSAIRVFTSQFGPMRVTVDAQNNPCFCLSDVCSVLDLTAKEVKRRLDDEVISKHPISDTLGRQQLALFVSEDGLYDVILDSRKPEAKKFRKWVTSEVLPSIRRTGGYVVVHEDDDPEVVIARGMMAAKEALERAEQRAIAAESQLQIAAPKVNYYDAVIEDRELFALSQLAGELGMNAASLRLRLFKEGVVTARKGVLEVTPEYESWGEKIPKKRGRYQHTFYWNKTGRAGVFNIINPEMPK